MTAEKMTPGGGFEIITLNAESARPGGLYIRYCGPRIGSTDARLAGSVAKRQVRLVTLNVYHFPMVELG